MVLEFLQNKSVSLPVVGPVSLAVAGVAGIAIFLLLRRKKSLSLKI